MHDTKIELGPHTVGLHLITLMVLCIVCATGGGLAREGALDIGGQVTGGHLTGGHITYLRGRNVFNEFIS